jgi:hypothetical protein
LGGSLSVFDAHEMHMVMWYLDYLLGLRCYNLADLQVNRETAGLTPAQRKKIDRNRGPPKPRAPSEHLRIQQAAQKVVRGLFRFLVVLLVQQRWKLPPHVARNMAARFQQRFSPLSAFSFPYTLGWADFASATDLRNFETAAAERVLASAQEALQEAAQLLTKLLAEVPPGPVKEELLALKKTCVGNNIAIVQLAKHPDKKISFSFAYHAVIPTIVIPA